MFETVQYVRAKQVIYITEIGGFAVIPAPDTAAMKDELVADFGIASTQVSAAAAFVILILSGFSAPHCGATVYHSDGSVASVQALHNAAHDGDTITIPAGTFDWTQRLFITKAITLQGQTTVTGAGTKNPTVNAITIARDQGPRGTGQKVGMITVTNNTGSLVRITGIAFERGDSTQTAGSQDNGVVQFVSSGSPSFNNRIDHCSINDLYHYVGIAFNGWTFGVADHNVIRVSGNRYAVYWQNSKYGGKDNGEGSWTDYPWFGTNKFFFLENNSFFRPAHATYTLIDGIKGGRAVFRYNYFFNGPIGSHGTEGGLRGTRCKEVYNNTFDADASIPYADNRGGGGALYHDNTAIGVAPVGIPGGKYLLCNSSNYRATSFIKGAVWGIADGTGKFDMNVTDVGANKWDQSQQTFVEAHQATPYVFDSGTVTSIPAKAQFTDSSKNWAVNQLAGYSFTNTNPASANYKLGSYIKSNTVNTITFAGMTGAGASTWNMAVGDTYQIHRLLRLMDGSGVGKTDLLDSTKRPPVNITTGGQSYAHSQLEPIITWKNTYGNAELVMATKTPHCVEGREYYNLGTGMASNTTPQQVIDTYTAAVNGVDYTGTFTYPHPLVTGAPTPTPSATPRSQQHLQKKKKNTKKLKRRNWPKKSTSDMANALLVEAIS